jgi:hypothetical protein
LARNTSHKCIAQRGKGCPQLKIYDLDGLGLDCSPSIPARCSKGYRSPILTDNPRQNEVELEPCSHVQVLKTSVTPVLAESLALLLNLIKRIPDNEANRQFRQNLHQKQINASQLCFTERALLQSQNQFLTKINNEGKVLRLTEFKVLGTAKVIA